MAGTELALMSSRNSALPCQSHPWASCLFSLQLRFLTLESMILFELTVLEGHSHQTSIAS